MRNAADRFISFKEKKKQMKRDTRKWWKANLQSIILDEAVNKNWRDLFNDFYSVILYFYKNHHFEKLQEGFKSIAKLEKKDSICYRAIDLYLCDVPKYFIIDRVFLKEFITKHKSEIIEAALRK